jgi:hypothetical protein
MTIQEQLKHELSGQDLNKLFEVLDMQKDLVNFKNFLLGNRNTFPLAKINKIKEYICLPVKN